MTILPTLGRLADVPVREAFAHEAHVLTPWLAANLDRISDAIGIPLEDADTEVTVEGFAADILAHDPANGRKVLIENQLEASDHTHLGQIMTYLAGLEASVMVWIAPTFREPHLAAIRWLNEHTVEPFAFFALRLRVVRIGESDLAPLLEVIERPNDWERAVQRAVVSSENDMAAFYNQFWSGFSDYLKARGKPYARTTAPNGPYYEVPIGRTGMWLTARASRRDRIIAAELYLGTAYAKVVFDRLHNRRAEYDQIIGAEAAWLRNDDAKASKIETVMTSANIEDESRREEQYGWLMRTIADYHRAFARDARQFDIEAASGDDPMQMMAQ